MVCKRHDSTDDESVPKGFHEALQNSSKCDHASFKAYILLLSIFEQSGNAASARKEMDLTGNGLRVRRYGYFE